MTMLQSGEAPAAGGVVKDTTTQTFVKDVIEESKRQPVLVDFWAEWCGPCKQLGPVLEKAVRAAKGKVTLVKMDIDKHPSIPGQLGIQSIPAVFAFVNGQPVDGFLGALPESQVVAFIERLTKDRIGGEEKDQLKAAEAALAANDPAGAAVLYDIKHCRAAEDFGAALLRAYEQIDIKRVLRSEVAAGGAITATHTLVEVDVARTRRVLHCDRDRGRVKVAGGRDGADRLKLLR